MSQRQNPDLLNSRVATSSKQEMMQQVVFPAWKTSPQLPLPRIDPSVYSLTFTPDMYGELKKQKYKTSKENNGLNTRKNIHSGQRKLLLSEILFLTKELDNLEDEIFCVYAGAAPGCGPSHLIELFDNFPNTKWLLCDPNFSPEDKRNFKSKEKQCVIYDKYFSQDCVDWITKYLATGVSKGTRIQDPASELHNYFTALLDSLHLKKTEDGQFFDPVLKDNILFISDIRQTFEKEDKVAEDMRNQQEWFTTLKARAGLFKFRLPYEELAEELAEPECEAGCEAECEAEGEAKNPSTKETVTEYLNGEIYWPVYGCPQTTECRLHAQRNAEKIPYNYKTHEEVMYYFNCHWRPQFDKWASLKIYAEFEKKFRESWKQGEFSTDDPILKIRPRIRKGPSGY